MSSLTAKLLTSEVLEDPGGVIANGILHAVQHLSANTQAFAGVYLLIHGLVKVGLVVALWTKRLWAYPVGAVVLVLFTFYQIYLFSRSGSRFQLFLTAVDLVVLFLLWSEYRRLRAHCK